MKEETQSIKLTRKEAKELLKTNNSLKDKLIAIYPELENKVISRWEDLKQIRGYFVSSQSAIKHTGQPCYTRGDNKNICATEAQAKSQLAYSQLTQLIKATGKGVTEEDWKDVSKIKFCVRFVPYNGNLTRNTSYYTFEFIAFTCEDTRNKFMGLHTELLLEYFKA